MSAELKLQGDEEKLLGNKFYKERDFDQAIVHYNKAWELFKDIIYLNNLSGKLSFDWLRIYFTARLLLFDHFCKKTNLN